MSAIKRLILDVLKPHVPSIIELAKRLGDLEGISGVNISLKEVDTDTDNVKITIEGDNIDYESVKRVIEECGAAIHSIDGVAAGLRLVEEISTPQDR
ncbi:MAG: DUF211 domain-containing protein [Thermoplasmata archaeon]|nr:DUF211 domain-containing protein [Thermoplasmata archaeon]